MAYDLSKLTHIEVSQLWEQREQIFVSAEVDLKATEQIDSAGIAFLVQWAKAQAQQKLTLHNASDNVQALIKTFNLEPLFVLD